MNNHIGNTTSLHEAEANTDLITIKGLKKYFSRKEGKVTAVDNIDLTLKKGIVVAIVGPSGSGKSTLLNMLGTLDSPTEGEVYVDGAKFHSLSEGEATHYRRTKIGYIFQSFNLIPNLSAAENVMLPMEYVGKNFSERRTRAERCLLMAELPVNRHNHLPAHLSGGEQQRVAIARALANNPPLILADEPTGSLDSKTSNQILELLCKLAREEGKTIVMVTHDMSIAARADVVVKLRDGKIEAIEENDKGTIQ